MSNFTLLPAIDIKDGQAVRLLKGELSNTTNYGTPAQVAKEFVDVFGQFPEYEVPFVHLVDLDAAFGTGTNTTIVSDVVTILRENNIDVEVSGGIRDDESLKRAIDLGATRVNIGTAALENPKWTSDVVGKFGHQVAIGLDVRGETLAARGWVKEGGNIWDVMNALLADGVSRFVITDVTKDGTLSGVNHELLTDAATRINEAGSSANVTASGGISSLEDVLGVQDLQGATGGIVDSVIFGKAMYAGRFTLSEAISACVTPA
jgi:1-(5-phosphoribosyl)-5-[(5-phosphoribosylamino)methylideneamino] imidazole-4-carboxamide isomerase/N-(5'phosphoribosyl)anthranilate isomerase